jgi:hypothetical protein
MQLSIRIRIPNRQPKECKKTYVLLQLRPSTYSQAHIASFQLPEGESMANTAANSDMSRQLKGKKDGVPDTNASGKNTSNDSQGGRRSTRGPGEEV